MPDRIRYAVRPHGREGEPAEGPLVDEPGLDTRVEIESAVQMGLVRSRRVADEHLAAHPEMDQESLVTVQDEPEVFPPASHVEDGAVAQPAAEIGRSSEVASSHAMTREAGVHDRPADDMSSQAATDHFDFGQFRHVRTGT